MTPRKAPGRSALVPAAAEHENDPRFVRLCRVLARDPRFAAPVADFHAAQAAGGPRRFGSNGLRVNGKVFAMMSQGTLDVKLPKSRVDALVDAGIGERFDPGHGRVMKEWLMVTDPRARWRELAIEAHDFVGGMSATR